MDISRYQCHNGTEVEVTCANIRLCVADTDLHGHILQCPSSSSLKTRRQGRVQVLKATVISNLLLIQVECHCLDCVGLLYVPVQDVHS